MGLKPLEVKALYLREFDLMLKGYSKRRENELNQMRHIMWSVINFAGMGASSSISPEALWPLPMDSETEKRMITSIAMAIKLLKEFD